MSDTTIFYASDIHGSDRCFRKFLNAAKFYGANVLAMGGDILGKAVVFLEEIRSGIYAAQQHGRREELSVQPALSEFARRHRAGGTLPLLCRRDAPTRPAQY